MSLNNLSVRVAEAGRATRGWRPSRRRWPCTAAPLPDSSWFTAGRCHDPLRQVGGDQEGCDQEQGEATAAQGKLPPEVVQVRAIEPSVVTVVSTDPGAETGVATAAQPWGS